MKVQQLSVFLENKPGTLVELISILGADNINIRAISIADTTDFGILRLIVSDPEKALAVLKDKGFTVTITEVIGVLLSDRPGGLSTVLAYLSDAQISVEYMYAYVSKAEENACIILRVDDTQKAIDVLGEKGVTIVDQAY